MGLRSNHVPVKAPKGYQDCHRKIPRLKLLAAVAVAVAVAYRLFM
jgi:hypothetical protein